jgi:hypothetical protein
MLIVKAGSRSTWKKGTTAIACMHSLHSIIAIQTWSSSSELLRWQKVPHTENTNTVENTVTWSFIMNRGVKDCQLDNIFLK